MTESEKLIDRINPVSLNRLTDSLESLVDYDVYTENHGEELEKAIEDNTYWHNHLGAHLLISVGTGVDPSGITSLITSSPIRTGYSLTMAGLEFSRKEYKKSLIHFGLSVPAFIPKAGGLVYTIPALLAKPKLAPVYLHSVISYIKDFIVDQEFQDLGAGKDALTLLCNYSHINKSIDTRFAFQEQKEAVIEKADQLSKRYLTRVVGEAAAVSGLMALQNFTDLPVPDLAYNIGIIGTGVFAIRDTIRYKMIGNIKNYLQRLK